MKKIGCLGFLLFCVCSLYIPSAWGQQNNTDLRTFLDCNRCDNSYIRDQIDFIQFVRDREDADLHILGTVESTGSGREYTFRFIGRDNFANLSDTLNVNIPSSDTDDEERTKILRYIKLGLYPFLKQNDQLARLDLVYNSSDESSENKTPEEDPWNSWIFEIDGYTSTRGEETSQSYYFYGGIEAEQVTDDWKVRFRYSYDYNLRRETFTETDDQGNSYEVTQDYITKGQRINQSTIRSITDHWSGGLFLEGFTSTRNNYDLSITASPGIEYSVFAYDDYASREITFSLLMSPTYRNYINETIYNQTEETLLRSQFRGRMNFTQPWGEIEGRANLYTYLHDFSKNRLDINMEVDFRIFRGFSISLDGRYSFINDQLSIPKGEISDAEQLLNLRQRLTSYSYRASIGIEYTFGSIFNSVVNPRF